MAHELVPRASCWGLAGAGGSQALENMRVILRGRSYQSSGIDRMDKVETYRRRAPSVPTSSAPGAATLPVPPNRPSLKPRSRVPQALQPEVGPTALSRRRLTTSTTRRSRGFPLPQIESAVSACFSSSEAATGETTSGSPPDVSGVNSGRRLVRQKANTTFVR